MMTVDHRLHTLEPLRSLLSTVVYPIQYLVNVPIALGQQVNNLLLSRNTLLQENSRLRHENLMLRMRTQKYAALETENVRLRELLDSSQDVGEKVLVAEVLAVEFDPSARQVLLNKGSEQGVFVGQPIVDAHGVMGQVTHVSPVSCTGMLITDVSHALPVQINRNGVRAIAMGTGDHNILDLAYIPLSADVRKGDLIVSSGMDGRFPSGYPVGEIVRVEQISGEPFIKVTAMPSAQLHRAHEALLVWTPERQGKKLEVHHEQKSDKVKPSKQSEMVAR